MNCRNGQFECNYERWTMCQSNTPVFNRIVTGIMNENENDASQNTYNKFDNPTCSDNKFLQSDIFFNTNHNENEVEGVADSCDQSDLYSEIYEFSFSISVT